MKKIIGLILITACSANRETYTVTKGPQGDAGSNGKSCTVSEVPEGALISCEDGTSSLVKNGVNGNTIIGPKGDTGNSGSAGSNGHNAVFSIVNTSTCATGGYTLLSSTDLNDNGLVDAGDSNIVSAQICNGAVGQTGSQGNSGSDGRDAVLPAFTVVDIVDPCGRQSNFDEVFLKLQNGTLIASFSDNMAGDYTHFTVLTPGVGFLTTDHTGCYFSVHADGSLYNEHN